jgi:hypothetical protein
MIIGVALRLFDMVTDISYVLFMEWADEELKTPALVFVVTFPGMVLTCGCCATFRSCACSNSEENVSETGAWCCWSCGFILPFELVECCNLGDDEKTKKKRRKNRYRTGILNVLECLFESLPMMIIQGINNTELGEWTDLAIISYTVSILNWMWLCFRG